MLRALYASTRVVRLTAALRVVVCVALAASIGSCGGNGGTDSSTETNNPPPQTLSPRLLHEFSPGAIGFYYNPPTLVGNAIYVGTSRGIEYQPGTSNAFYKLSSTLAKVWEYPLGSKEVRGGAALDAAGNIYFAVEEGRFLGTSNPSVFWLYSLDANGTLRWTKQIRRTLPNVGMNNPAIAADNTIYIGGNKFYAFDTDGNQKWAYQEAASLLVLNAPIIDPTGNIYFSSQNTIYSLSPSGVRRWRVTTSGEPYSSPAFSVDHSKVSEANAGKQLHALDLATGTEKWSSPLRRDATWSSPAIADDGTLYIGSMDINGDGAALYSFRTDATGLLRTAGSPRFHGSNANNGRRN